MIGSRVLGAACAAILISTLGSLVGCGSADESAEATSTKTIQAASVSLVLHDENGVRIGEGSGILLAPRVVLTSGHLIAGKARWTVTSADGKTKVNGIRGMTYDWMKYDSDKAHPRKHDVGIVYLDRPIELAAYPRLATEKVASGAQGTRIRGTGLGFQQISTTLERHRTFPHAYTTDIPGGETLDTGGAVLNSKNEIIGLVTGRGHKTGKLYIARTNDLTEWLSPKVACGAKKNAALGLRVFANPTPKEGCDENGNPIGSSSGASGGSNGPGSSGGASSSGGDGSESCEDGGGNSWGGGGGSGGGSSSGGSSSGSSGSDTNASGSSSGGSGTSGGGGASSSSGAGSTSSSGGTSGSDGNTSSSSSSGAGSTSSSSGAGSTSSSSGAGSTSSSSGAGSTSSSSGAGSTSSSGGTSGSDGNTSSSSSGANGTSGGGGASSSSSGANGTSGTSGTPGSSGTSGTPGSSGAGASSGSSGGDSDNEVCTGPTDNPEVCPPEAPGCAGSSCGGSNELDDTIDYGVCGGCAAGASGGSFILR